jgi:putative ABC transport system permease protein
MFLGEAVRFSWQALRASPIRSVLTGLGMAIGTASVILVVTISLTSRDYILEQVQGIGSNIIFAYYAAAGGSTVSDADYIKMPDVQAIRQELTSDIVAATGVMSNFDRILIAGKEQDVKVIGTDQDYQPVRNIVISSGRFLDQGDITLRTKAALLTDQLAARMFGGRAAALSQVVKLYGLEFTVIGTFHEKVETFGQSEVERDTILIPITVLRYFTPVERIDPLYVQVRSPREVERVAARLQEILEARHRPGARYRVDTLTAILNAAKNISLILVLVSAITLVISGIGIMNIMLVTVTERTREIGVRLAVGAAPREILLQFLTEAILVSLSGGLLGILVGVAIPLSVQLFADIRIPISPVAIAVAFGVSCLVGLVFGMLPANRAAHLHPTEALRYE